MSLLPIIGSAKSITSLSLGNETDRLALVAFKAHITHDPQQFLNSWNTSLHFCNWKGVSCDHQHQRVEKLVINSHGLVGSLSPHIGNLTFLQTLNLENNSLHGEIPREVGHLFSLHELKMSSNYFVGEIPLSLSNCSNLKTISLAYNKLTSKQLGDVIIPKSSKTNFSSQLSVINLAGNQIHGSIPVGIESLVNLTVFDMHRNHLTGSLPSGIGKLQFLQNLDLRDNHLSGELPSSLGNLSQLVYIGLSNNNLEGGIVPSIANCKSLQGLDLLGNNMTGTIPKHVFGLLQLFCIYLGGNSFTGSLPKEVGNLQYLVVLDVSDNKITGEIPSTLGNCLSLEQLFFKGNSFQGSIPPSFHSLKGLDTLDLSMNNLHGQIPMFLQNMSALQNLNLSFNDFEGEVPMRGVFQNTSALLIRGNKKLCGGIQQLQLPSCPNKKTRKHQVLSPALKISLGVTLSMIVLASFLGLFIYCWKRPTEKSSTIKPFREDHFRRVSYQDLYKATDGFAPTNLAGTGSFGAVYRGVVDEDEGPIAVKVLNLIQRYASKSFMTECEALRKVRHRNLLKILTACSTVDFQGNDFKALIFKFMPNGSLENWLHPSSDGRHDMLGSLDLSQRINIAIDIASALDYLHNQCEAPIVHCDLKPSNVLLDEDMVAHVGDFGLAKFLQRNDSDSSRKESSSIFPRGTIGYIPPEYGIGVEASTQGDVFSYGVLLLEMITGKRPTNEMFKDGLDLHCFSMMALPEQVMKIVDPTLLLEDVGQTTIINYEIQKGMRDRVQECLISLVKVGVACSTTSPRERLDIKDALTELLSIKELMCGS